MSEIIGILDSDKATADVKGGKIELSASITLTDSYKNHLAANLESGPTLGTFDLEKVVSEVVISLSDDSKQIAFKVILPASIKTLHLLKGGYRNLRFEIKDSVDENFKSEFTIVVEVTKEAAIACGENLEPSKPRRKK